MTVEHKGLELGLATVDANVDAILVDTGTTLDGKVDSILTDTGTTLDGKVDSILTDTGTTLDAELEIVETHAHCQNKVYGLAGSSPLIMARESVTALSVTGGAAAFGTSVLLHKGDVGGAYFDLNKIQVTSVGTANRPTLIEFYSGTLGDGVVYSGEADDDFITAVGHGCVDGDRIIFDTMNDETKGVTRAVVYFVRDRSGDTFKVEETSGGGAINITGDISGNLKKVSSPTLKTECMVSMAATNADAQPISFGCPRIASTSAFWCRAKAATDTNLVTFFVDLHTYTA